MRWRNVMSKTPKGNGRDSGASQKTPDIYYEDTSAKGVGRRTAQTRAIRGRRRVFFALLASLIVVVLLIAARSLYVVFYDPMRAFDMPPGMPAPSVLIENTPSPNLVAAAPPAVDVTPAPTLSPEEALQARADTEFMKNKVNILMLGWDQSPEREEEDNDVYRDEDNNYRSDVIILLTIDFEKNRVDMISIPRDTYAPIYNTKGRWKINAAFAKGGSAEGEGFEYAMYTVSALLGVPIQYYAGVDMVGLKAVVDAMGGVDYDVDVRINLNGRILEKGYQHLDGQQVLDYCRARKGISTDVGRADRQQRMLFTIFEQLKSRNQLVNIPKIYGSVQDKIRTNLNSEQIAALAVFAMGLDMNDLNRHTLEGSYVNDVYSASFYVLNNSKLKALVKEIYGIDLKTNPAYDLDYVRADKAVASAAPYLDGASYLLEVFAAGSGADEVRNAAEALQAVAERSAKTGSGGDESPLDRAAIENAIGRLSAAMLALCRNNGVMQEDVIRTKLPPDLYNQLPTQASAPDQGDFVSPQIPLGDDGTPAVTPRPRYVVPAPRKSLP